MNYTELLEKVQKHVVGLFQTRHTPVLVYHSLAHTEQVVHNAISLSTHHQLSEDELFIVQAAAWFHDTGYLFNIEDHEHVGALEAERFLQAQQISPEIIGAVKSAICATRLPQSAAGITDKIVCDADLYHFGTKEFVEINKLVRKEKTLLYPNSFTKEAWLRKTISLLESHEYQTEYCKKHLAVQKEKNLLALQKKLKKDGEDMVLTAAKPEQKTDASEKSREDKPSRGIETMFRISSANHQRLSDMADNKANIIITVNSIILSAILSFLIRKLDSEEYLAYPTYIILLVSLTAMIFAILSTRPAITKGSFSQQEVDEKKANLLFFGNFHKESLEKYSASMQVAMNDKQYLYDMLIKDLHSQGVVLGKKYRLLRISYNIFMYGLVVAVLAFLLASLIYA